VRTIFFVRHADKVSDGADAALGDAGQPPPRMPRETFSV